VDTESAGTEHVEVLFARQRSPREDLTLEKGEGAMKKILKVRGASMVEYALLLVAVLLLAAAAYKALGPAVGRAATNATGQL
jgi:Flp pilus assembly pilin Flp